MRRSALRVRVEKERHYVYDEYISARETKNALAGVGSDHWSGVWRSRRSDVDNDRAMAETPQYKAIEPRLESGSRILEAGCGLGAWVRFLSRRGFDVSGLDFSGETIARLRREYPENHWVDGDVLNLEGPDLHSAFDAILSWGVVEHFFDGPERAIEQMAQCLKPGGILFLTVPWVNTLRARRWKDVPNNRSDENGEFVQRYFTESEIVEAIRASGLRVIETRPAAIRAKSILPRFLADRHPRLVRLISRGISPCVPASLIAHMILVVAERPDGEPKNA